MERPYLVTYGLASLDGRISLAPDVLLLQGDERWSAVADSGEDVYQRLITRHRPRAFLEGSGSFVLDGSEIKSLPEPTTNEAELYNDFLPEAVVKHPERRGWFTAVDGRGRIRWMFKEWPDEAWAGWHALALVGRHTPASYLAYLRREGIPYLVAGSGPVNLRLALEKMRALLGVETVVSTAGGRLNGALLAAGLVDEVTIDFFPALISGRGTPSLFDGPPLAANETPVRLKLLSAAVQGDGRLLVRYRVKRSEDDRN